MQVAKCRSCGKPIIWAVAEKGKRMPVDAEESEAGQFFLDDSEDPPKAFFGRGELPAGYTSHFATCPNASQHRKGGR